MASVLVKIKSRALGDNIGAVPCIEEWRRRTGTRVFVLSAWKRILSKSYPNLIFIDDESVASAWDRTLEIDYRFDLPLQTGFANALGMEEWQYVRPKVDPTGGVRPIKAKYVTLGIQSTAQCKYWNFPDGWNLLSKELRKLGVTPVCIDQYESFGIDGHFNLVPRAAVRRLNSPIEGTINYLEHAEFHIGISSGLSWVAHALGKRVVMISGATSIDNEFSEDCVRLINTQVCHGCINEPKKHPFNPKDWLWCPVHRGTDRQFECTKEISPANVIKAIVEAGWI
jgi:autotransporter strand-loop-strand O-heptosyltransferase